MDGSTCPEGTHPAPTHGTDLIESTCPWMDGSRAMQEQLPRSGSFAEDSLLQSSTIQSLGEKWQGVIQPPVDRRM
jgi:hypothetical protein